MYSPEMQETIVRLLTNRDERLKVPFKRITLEEKMPLLNQYHPDYVMGAMREIKVGVSKGSKAPQELADLLEGHSRVNPDKIDLSKLDYDVDVLIIGGGGAGASAALLAQEQGVNVLLVTKLRLGDANTVGAQAGTQAADRAEDSPAIHYLDTMGGGGFANVPELVEALTMDAPDAIKWLEDMGVMWDKTPDGKMYELSGGGASRRRLHSCRDYTGLEEMRVLRDELRNRQINYLEFEPAVELILDEGGQAAGAILMNLETKEISIVKAKAVVMATGGGGRLHYQGYPTTNHYGATADGLVMAYRAGAKLIYVDTMQYHPTGVSYPPQIIGQLVSEKVRTLGAQLVNRDGERFIHHLETRDVVASAIIRECRSGRGITTPTGQPGVWLDSPMIEILRGQGTILKEIPAMFRQFMRYGIDMSKDPILVYPTLHYQNGGILISPDATTTVPGLFAAGEVEGGVHGRNRLIGNSTLDIFVFGRRAGVAAGQYAQRAKPGKLSLNHVRKWEAELKKAGLETRPVSPILLPNYTHHENPVGLGVGIVPDLGRE
jgi:succinate dehydrogenase / fumarate reductase flavoprotein subunit